MPPIPLAAGVLIAALAASAIIASLHVLAKRRAREIAEDDLRVRTDRRRGEYARWMAAVRRGEGDTVQRPMMLDAPAPKPRRAA